LSDFGLKAAQAADIAGRDAHRFERLCESPEWRALDDLLLRPTSNEERPKIGKKRGRHSNLERRAAIRDAITKHGDWWRDHLTEIFADLDGRSTPLGNFEGLEIDLGDDTTERAVKWEDLDLTHGDQRAKVIDTLRKYV
jgi:hypothetical protein